MGATLGGAGASGLSDLIALAFPISADGTIPLQSTHDQPTVEELLKQQIRDSPGWNSASSALFAGLPFGIPFTIGLIAKLAEQFTGLDVSTWVDLWLDNPITGNISSVVSDALAQIFTLSVNMQSLLGSLNFLDPDFDPDMAILDFINLMLIPSNLLANLVAGFIPGGLIPGLDASKIISGLFGTGLIPGLDVSKIVSGIFGAGFIPGLDASKIISGVFGAGLLQPVIDAVSQGFGGIPGLGFAGLQSFLSALNIDVQPLVDGLFNLLSLVPSGSEVTGTLLDDLLSAFEVIPSIFVTGYGGPGNAADTWQATWDNILGGVVGIAGIGSGLGDLFNIFYDLSSKAAQGPMALNILGLRNNRATWRGMLPSSDATLALNSMMFNKVSGTPTAPTVNVPVNTALIAWDLIAQDGIKQAIQWHGSGNSGLTDFRMRLWEMNTATGITHCIYTSSNALGSVGSALGVNTHAIENINQQTQFVFSTAPSSGGWSVAFDGETTSVLPPQPTTAEFTAAMEALPNVGTGNVNAARLSGSNYLITFQGDLAAKYLPPCTIATNTTGFSVTTTQTPGSPKDWTAGEIFGVEWHPIGSGSGHNIVGDTTWINYDHPTVFPRRKASTRSAGSSTGMPADVSSPTYANTIPLVEFAASTGNPPAPHSPLLMTFTTVETSSVPIPDWANTVQLIVISGGGRGAAGTGFYGLNGAGGDGGVIGTLILTRGTHFTSGDIVNYTVGPGSTGSGAGGTSSAGVGAFGVTRSGGTDGSGVGTGSVTHGLSPGSVTVDSVPYAGGAEQASAGANGNPYGGGGAGGGFYGAGGYGAQGVVWVRFKQ